MGTDIKELQKKAKWVRKQVLEMVVKAGAGHIAPAFSCAEILVALYYGHILRFNPKYKNWQGRDRFILSKGHGAVCMYIAMCLRGFFDYDEIVRTYGKLDSKYGMHVCKVYLPEAECSSGSLGQGLAVAVGMAFSAKQKKQKHRVYCMMGDGETCEGEIWEAANTAASYKLGNLIGIVDFNKQLMSSMADEAMSFAHYADRWRAFGWDVKEIDGHNMAQIIDAIDSIPPITHNKPTAIIANTIKGKGVSFMEKVVGWHAGSLSKEDTEKAIKDVEAAYLKERVAV